MKKLKIFVIIGSAGEYSGHREWIVKAINNETLAKEIVSEMEEKSRIMHARFEDDYEGKDKMSAHNGKDLEFARKFVGDPNCNFSWDITHYHYATTFLEKK